MNTILILTAALLPAILLGLYIWRQDSKPEPTNCLVKAVLYGIGICIPVVIMEMGIGTILFGAGGKPTTIVGTTIQAFFVAALPEESFKLLALWLVLRKNPYFDEHFDGIVYAVFVGLGFAAIENVFFLINNVDNWLSIAISRSLLAVPGHYAFAVLMGYYYSVYHFVDQSSRTAACVIFVPVIPHGIYDALAFCSTVNEYLGGLCFVILIYFCVKMHKFAKKKVIAQIERDKNGLEQRTS